jgi:hypothetical protein
MPDILPKKKPYTEDMFKKDADLYIKGFLGGFPKDEMNQLLKQKILKIEDEGVMSSDEAKDFIKERAYYLKEFAKENPGKTLPELKASGGRIGFLKGGDTKYNAMVTEMYIKLGGKEGTGMDIDTFAEEYFKKFSTGGRVNYNEGSMDPDTLKLQAKVKEIMDIEGLDFGEAFKKALREIKAEARDISD